MLAVVNGLVQPSPSSEVLVVRLTNFLGYLLALAGFEFLLTRLIASHQTGVTLATPLQPKTWPVPDWIWLVLGYLMFLWCSLKWIGLRSDTPDMVVSALVYIAAGLVIRSPARQQPEPRTSGVGLGLVLGLAALAKTAMYPAGFILLIVDGLTDGRSAGRRWRRTCRGLAAFALVGGPFVAAVSLQHGHPTIGDSGKLTYALLVNPTRAAIREEHWQGWPPGYGTPDHPSRQVATDPDVFEFAGPVRGTYPPWTDPSYWYEGLTLHFSASAQLEVLRANVAFYYDMFLKYVIALYVVVFCLGGFSDSAVAAMRHHWKLPWWAAALLVGYMVATNLSVSNIPTQPSTRLVAPFVVLAFGAMLAGLRLPDVRTTQRALSRVTIIVALVMGSAMLNAVRDDMSAIASEEPVPWQVAIRLHDLGIQPGDGVAILGRRYDRDHDHEFWARLARVHIVSHIPDDAEFFRTPPRCRDRLYAVLAATGAKALVYKIARRQEPGAGWRTLEAGYYAYLLSNGPSDASAAGCRRLDETDH